MYDTNSMYSLGHRRLVYPSHDSFGNDYKSRNEMKYLQHTSRSPRRESNYNQAVSNDLVKVYHRRSYLSDNNGCTTSPRSFLNHNSTTQLKPALIYAPSSNYTGSVYRLSSSNCSPQVYKRLSNVISRENLVEKYKSDQQRITSCLPAKMIQQEDSNGSSKQANGYDYGHGLFKQSVNCGSSCSPENNGYKIHTERPEADVDVKSSEELKTTKSIEKDEKKETNLVETDSLSPSSKFEQTDENNLSDNAKLSSPPICDVNCTITESKDSTKIVNGKQGISSDDYLPTNSSKSIGIYNNTHGISPHVAIALYRSQMTRHECKEIEEYPEIHFLGLNAIKRYPAGTTLNEVLYDPAFNSRANNTKPAASLIGFDDSQSGYIISLNDHIAYRYEVLKVLGKGSFGQVIHAFDHRNGQQVAIKIIRKEARFTRQSVEELRILKILNEQQIQKDYNVVKLLHHFVFRGHVCMVFELLNINLFELIHRNRFRGLSQNLTRKLITSILNCLCLLHRNNIIHCDLKPENILLRSSGKVPIKVIDFGSSCFVHNRTFNYIQSRFYRAPEVILGLPYNTPIDMWSLGCILAELITGVPLFPGEDESDQLAAIMELLDVPPLKMIQLARRSHLFFTVTGEPLYVAEQLKQDQQNLKPNLDNQQDTDSLCPNNSTPNMNSDVEKSKSSSSVQSINAAGKTRTKSQNKSKYWRQRQPPGSKDLVTVLTTTGNSSVYLPSATHTNGYTRVISSGDKLPQPIDPDMVDFLSRCLEWVPENRMTPMEALQHAWIVKKQTPNANTQPQQQQQQHQLEQHHRSSSIYLPVEDTASLSPQQQQKQQNQHYQQQQQSLFTPSIDPASLQKLSIRIDKPGSSLANLLGVRLRRHRNRTSDSRKSDYLSAISLDENGSNINYRRYSSDQEQLQQLQQQQHYFPRNSEFRRSSRLSFIRSNSNTSHQNQPPSSGKPIELQQYRPFLRDSTTIGSQNEDSRSTNSHNPSRNVIHRPNAYRRYKSPSYYDGLNFAGRIRVGDSRYRLSTEIQDPTL